MESIKLNLIPSGVNPTCHCSQYDEGRVIRIDLFDGLTPYALQSGDAVTLNVRKPDNTIVTTAVTTTQGNTYVEIVTTQQMCAVVGFNLCDLTITNGSTVIGTLNFVMAIERDVLADGIPSQSVIEDLGALIAEELGDDYYTKAETDAALALKADASETSEALNEINDEIDLIEGAVITKETQSKTESISASDYTTGAVNIDGTVLSGGSYDNYKYSGQINVKAGDIIRGVTFRFVTAYENGVVNSALGGNSVRTYTVPEGVTSIVVTVSQGVSSFTHDYTETVYNRISDYQPLANDYSSKTGSFTQGGLYNYILITNIKNSLSKNFRAVFECDCVSGTDFDIGFTVSGSTPASVHNNVVSINSTTISYDGNNYTHGLTIEGRLKVILELLDDATAAITLMANGNTFKQTIAYALTTCANPYVMSQGLIANNCKLVFTCTDFRKKIWIFGDSYLSYATNRWRYYLHEYGYDKNCLINAFAGSGSVNAIAAFEKLVAFGKPEFAVWFMGMNDGSDTNASTPSSTWVTNRDAFLQLCEDNNITPVFATIPNVPNVSNVGKNAWIKASGYKYIDMCHAVGADESTSWLGDMLSNDNVHPSVTGAKALFAQVLVDFAEIMIEQ